MTSTAIARPMAHLSHDYDVVVKAIVIGDSSVGKTSLMYRYIEQDWNPHYIATIGVDFKVLTFERQQKIVKLQLWDTAGQERFRTITHTYYRGVHGVFLVFDVTNRESFENIQTWVKDVQRFGSDGVPMLLVGNKKDCPAAQREVSDEEAQALANSLGCKYLQTSARTSEGVDAAFTDLLECCIERRLEAVQKMGGGGRKPTVVLGGDRTKKPSKFCGCN